MSAIRFDATGSETPPLASGPTVRSVLDESHGPRMQCVDCGAHAVGLLTRGGWCSTCGSRELVPVAELASDTRRA